MAHEVVMPQLGLSMDSGEIIRWLKQPGDPVHPGELLLEVESDKSTVEVEAVEEGILHIVHGPGDGPIAVGEVIAYLLAEGELPPAGASPVPAALPVTETFTPAIVTVAARTVPAAAAWPRPNRPPSSPAARRRAGELGVDWRRAAPTGRGGRIKERDVVALAAATAQQPVAVSISPVARRMAESAGLSLDALARQHPGRRLERADVEEAIRQKVSAVPSAPAPAPVSWPAPSPAADHRAPGQRKPASSLRRLIAERMAHSAHTTAPVTLTTEADATELVKIREGLKADPGTEVPPSYNALFAALTARALVEHPYMNATLDGADVVTWGTVNLGIAVDTERGLVVPVLRDVQTRPVRALAQEMGDLLGRASQGKALPDELTGGTFTLTNLGAYDIDAFTPIINPPECAVLGIGRLVQKVVAVDGQPAVRTMVALSLTFDHRLVDGAPAARFLKRVKQFVEQPYLWLV
jgi:pyruvate dehydrogenase E2 component (dihydrolipoamide acetyltransferase)